MTDLRASLGDSMVATRRVVTNPDLRRLEIAWTLATAAQWSLVVALLVYAYAAGGSVAVAVLGLARTLPTLVGVPLASALGDRAPRARVLLLMDLIAFAASAASAVALAMNAHIVVIFALAAVTAVSSAAIRPLQNSIIPELARSPEELVASNVVTSAGEGIGVLLGPAVAAILLTFGPAAAATAGAIGMLAACLAVIRIQPTRVPLGHEHHHARARPGVLAGFMALRGLPGPRLIIAVFGVQPFIRGALTVLTVAASIELLGLGEPGVGILNSAAGAGGIVGAVATLALVGRPRMAGFFWLGLILWGVPVTVMGLVPWAPVALFAMAVIGAGNALLDVAGFTILQRIVPNQVRTSVLGVFEADVAAMAGLGGLVAPLLISLFDLRGALIVTGAILPVIATLAWPGIRRADATAVVPERQVALLRGVTIFNGLPVTIIEQLAGALEPLTFAPGDVVMRQGDPGERFVLIETGTVDVEQDGRPLAPVGPGGHVGEIALLREIPRTATVRAATVVHAYALDRASFIAAVTGDRAAADEAERVVQTRLANTG